jgi:hypothetical protein
MMSSKSSLQAARTFPVLSTNSGMFKRSLKVGTTKEILDAFFESSRSARLNSVWLGKDMRTPFFAYKLLQLIRYRRLSAKTITAGFVIQ